MVNGYGGGDSRQRIFVEDQRGRVRREARVAAEVSIDRLVPALVRALELPQVDGAHRPIAYTATEGDRVLSPQATLQSAGVEEGATLVLVPEEPATGAPAVPVAGLPDAEARRLAQSVAEEVMARLWVSVSRQQDMPKDDAKPRATIVVRPTFGVPDEAELPRRACFVTGPPVAREVFDHTVRPLLVQEQLDFHDAADVAVDADAGWSALLGCSFVLADCTGRNAEVFYDLARAQVLGKPTTVLAQSPADLPRSVSAGSAILYTDNGAGLAKLRRDLERVFRQRKERPSTA